MPYPNELSKQTVVRGWEYCIPKYAEAGAAIDVGDLVGFNADGQLVPAAAATAGTGTVRVAIPRRERGMGEIANAFAGRTSYAAGEEMAFVTPHRGVEILMNLTENQTVTTGTTVNGTANAGKIAANGNVAATGTLVGDVVAPDGVDDLANYSVTTGAGENKKVIVEVR